MYRVLSFLSNAMLYTPEGTEMLAPVMPEPVTAVNRPPNVVNSMLSMEKSPSQAGTGENLNSEYSSSTLRSTMPS